MEFDPSARDGPPPRHAIESDSEESDENDGELDRRDARSSQLRSQRLPRVAFKPPSIELRSSSAGAALDTSIRGKPLVVLVGAQGEAYLDSPVNARLKEQAGIWVDDEQQAALHTSGACSVVLLHPSSGLASHQAVSAYLGAALISSIQPSSVIVVDEYVPSLYLYDIGDDSDNGSRSQSDEPIRWLHATKPALAIAPGQPDVSPFQAPNYLTGLGAAILTEASIATLPATLVLLPRTVANTVNPYLQSSQLSASTAEARTTPLDPRYAQQLTTLLAPVATQLRLTEQNSNSEPLLPSFLHKRRTADRKRAQRDISAMYM